MITKIFNNNFNSSCHGILFPDSIQDNIYRGDNNLPNAIDREKMPQNIEIDSQPSFTVVISVLKIEKLEENELKSIFEHKNRIFHVF